MHIINDMDNLTQAAQQVSDQLYGMGGVCGCLPVPVVSALLTQSLFSYVRSFSVGGFKHTRRGAYMRDTTVHTAQEKHRKCCNNLYRDHSYTFDRGVKDTLLTEGARFKPYTFEKRIKHLNRDYS